MITIPLLDFFFAIFLCVLSIAVFLEGWLICFENKKKPLFIFTFFHKIAEFLGNGERYREWMLATITPSIMLIQGYSALIGGLLGLIGGLLMFYDAFTHIKIS